jgi:hypothetical protein
MRDPDLPDEDPPAAWNAIAPIRRMGLHQLPRRSECVGGPRPCPLVGCRYNNFLRITPQGHLRLTSWKEPEDVPPRRSCSLDLADDGPQTLETIGETVGLTRERVRQIETLALLKMIKHVGEEEIRCWREKLFGP